MSRKLVVLKQSVPVLWRLGVVIGVFIFAMALSVVSAGAKVKNYKTTRIEGNQVVLVDHFEMNDQILSLELSPQWGMFRNEGDVVARFEHRLEEKCSIEIRVFPLAEMPEDQKAANKLYLSEIQKMKPPNVNNGEHAPDFKIPSAFPQFYALSDSREKPPRRLVTFFVYTPYLYRAVIDFRDQLIAQPRVDYEAMLGSILIKTSTASQTNAPASQVAVSETNSVTQTKAVPVKAPSSVQTNQTDNATVPAGQTN